MVKKYFSGFTLIELMIVVAVIAILAAIAYPSYQDSVRRAKRIDAQSTMMDIASRLQKYKIARFSFEKADGSFVTLADVGVTNQIPSSGTALYTIALSDQGLGSWTLTATPTGSQSTDGHLVLNHRGQRCWTKGSDNNSGTACVPSATSNWDGK
ncbi:pilus assembly protein PilE [Acinetobacter idrijaensis]|uniref:type IV pilin protein n=1 Tax=Acinetobacter indicus TaxID=756892 RepID=UPI00051394FD|nr:type IV pilin protein [Acinetobacter indicus]KGH51313.1 pilus assembly protein PilE [Acinetobacter idrijaensis]MDM1329618.1 prepilin-type N-terminal cleavage/methylation domain-containing protein [Acinetobacter indicus]MDM1338017.1 prepilin-type N-terminal cleavage/methylation domain-containing protein [Acinetobacter indicus]